MIAALFVGVMGLILYYEMPASNWCYLWIFMAAAGFAVAGSQFGSLKARVRKLEGKNDDRN